MRTGTWVSLKGGKGKGKLMQLCFTRQNKRTGKNSNEITKIFHN